MSKTQYTLNRKIEQFLSDKTERKESFSIEDLAYVNQFTGYGGMAQYGAEGKGLLSEYFTPIEIIEKMVGLAYKHGYAGGAVLEPSCGIGRFLHYFAPTTRVNAFEINETSCRIAQVNFPTFNIRHAYFNELFIERNGKSKAVTPTYKLVIGNPPYGDFTGKLTSKERKNTGATRYEDYFILRGLDLLQKGGLLVYIVPSSFLDGKENAVKKQVEVRAELLEAYRLPKGIFRQTDIQTDIIVLRKI